MWTGPECEEREGLQPAPSSCANRCIANVLPAHAVQLVAEHTAGYANDQFVNICPEIAKQVATIATAVGKPLVRTQADTC